MYAEVADTGQDCGPIWLASNDPIYQELRRINKRKRNDRNSPLAMDL